MLSSNIKINWRRCPTLNFIALVIGARMSIEHWWNYLFDDSIASSGPRLPRFRSLTITFRHTKLDRIPLDEWSDSRRYRYLKTTQHSQDREHPCSRQDSNPQSQQASSLRPTPLTARPLGSAWCNEPNRKTRRTLKKTTLFCYFVHQECHKNFLVSKHRA
jgi:hypothetical protein